MKTKAVEVAYVKMVSASGELVDAPCPIPDPPVEIIDIPQLISREELEQFQEQSFWPLKRLIDIARRCLTEKERAEISPGKYALHANAKWHSPLFDMPIRWRGDPPPDGLSVDITKEPIYRWAMDHAMLREDNPEYLRIVVSENDKYVERNGWIRFMRSKGICFPVELCAIVEEPDARPLLSKSEAHEIWEKKVQHKLRLYMDQYLANSSSSPWKLSYKSICETVLKEEFAEFRKARNADEKRFCEVCVAPVMTPLRRVHPRTK